LVDAFASVAIHRTLWSPAWYLNLIASRILGWQGDWGHRAKLGWVGEELAIAVAIAIGAWVLLLRTQAVESLTRCAIVATPWLTNSEAVALVLAAPDTMLSKPLVVGILGACIASAAIAVGVAQPGKRGTSLALGTATVLASGALIHWLNSPTRLIFQVASAISAISLFATLLTRSDRPRGDVRFSRERA
jgi:hypothetical protein